ncbi:methyltransferase domain-containing protein [Isosphaeraceae bacterium EP7]
MELAELQKHWNAFGETDPLWAILTSPSKRGGKWDLKEFFGSGQGEIDWAVKHVRSFGVTIDRSSALDFGCGVGRLTQALCDHFEHCVGIDIAPSMIEHARRLNQFGARCEYVVNDRSDLGVFPDATFSFIYSNIVLQHINPEFSRKYIQEFVRILKPGGIALFQIPSEWLPNVEDTAATALRLSLSDADFRARIMPRRPLRQIRPGEKAVINVKVKNTGVSTWPAPDDCNGCEVRLGNHWLDAEGAMLVADDARASLTKAVPPGGTVNLQLEVKAPKAVGKYRLELDLVRESISWFNNRGSATVVLDVEVSETARRSSDGLVWKLGQGIQQASARLVGPKGRTPGRLDVAPTASSVEADFEPVMETHGIPKPEVIALVEGAGGTIVGITPNQRTGHNWSSFDYCVTKKA